MKRIMSGAVLAGMFVSSAHAVNYCPETVFSSNSIQTPIMFTQGIYWAGGIYVTNVSDVPIVVKYELTDMNGEPYTPYSVLNNYNFSSSNTPLNLIDGATLQPGEMGRVFIKDDNTEVINVGKITWSADACLDEALMVNFYNQYNIGGKAYDSGWMPLNGGKPF